PPSAGRTIGMYMLKAALPATARTFARAIVSPIFRRRDQRGSGLFPSPAPGTAARVLSCGCRRASLGLVQPGRAHSDEQRIALQAEQDVRVLQCLAFGCHRLGIAGLRTGKLGPVLNALARSFIDVARFWNTQSCHAVSFSLPDVQTSRIAALRP